MLILRNQEDHGLCSYSSVCSHPENSWVKSQFVHPSPPRRSVHIHDGLSYASRCHNWRCRKCSLCGGCDRTPTRGASGGAPPSQHAPQPAPAPDSRVDAEGQEFVRVMVVQGSQVRQTQQQLGEEGAVIWAPAGDEGAQGLY